MKYFSLFSHKSVRRGKSKLVPEEACSTLLEANEILNITKEDAIKYRKDVAKECEFLKEEAEKEGFEKGLETLYAQHLHLKKLTENTRQEMQKKIFPLAINAAKKILGEELELRPERIVEIIIQALKPVTQHHKITIYVSPKDLEVVEKKKQHIKKLLEQTDILKIEAKPEVEPGGCMIETESGMINAQLETQWRALEAALVRFRSS